jgi:hypothetical protein
MGLVDSVKKALGRPPASGNGSGQRRREPSAETTGEDMRVPEVTAVQLMAELGSGPGAPLLVDIRENSERAQSFIPGSLHIPMNSVPSSSLSESDHFTTRRFMLDWSHDQKIQDR